MSKFSDDKKNELKDKSLKLIKNYIYEQIDAIEEREMFLASIWEGYCVDICEYYDKKISKTLPILYNLLNKSERKTFEKEYGKVKYDAKYAIVKTSDYKMCISIMYVEYDELMNLFIEYYDRIYDAVLNDAASFPPILCELIIKPILVECGYNINYDYYEFECN